MYKPFAITVLECYFRSTIRDAKIPRSYRDNSIPSSFLTFLQHIVVNGFMMVTKAFLNKKAIFKMLKPAEG